MIQEKLKTEPKPRTIHKSNNIVSYTC